jgi:hypothetical protein
MGPSRRCRESASPLAGEDSKSARDEVECLGALGEGLATKTAEPNVGSASCDMHD